MSDAAAVPVDAESTRRHARTDFPTWIREVDLALPVCPQFLITGNLRDNHLLPTGDPRDRSLVSTVALITDCLVENGYSVVLQYDPVDGISVLHEAEAGTATLISKSIKPGVSTAVTVPELTEILKQVVASTDRTVAILLDYASRMRGDNQDPSVELQALLAAGEKLAYTSRSRRTAGPRIAPLYNSIFWLVDRELDLPHWLSSIESVRVVSLPVPTLATRLAVAERLTPSIPGSESLTEVETAAVAKKFAELSQGMTLRSMVDITMLARDGGVKPTKIEEAVRSYRVGVPDNPWQDPVLGKRILAAEKIIGETKVLGQPKALRKALDILVRSAVGLTGAQSGGQPGRPQGILFFAGPTGVGKTEMAKSLAEVVFGTADAYTRFDMSEFSAEQSEARLIGAPPGYIGHDAGGELTNAVRERPFSLLLFDEVEKAHPRILDKFLQILEDGRLTDGSGSTVYFSETIIVFTSNLGIYDTKVTDGVEERVPIVTIDEDDYDVIETKVRAAIDKHFTLKLQRPELLNRIGDNIVVFDFISEEIGRRLVEKYINNVVDAAKEKLNVTLTVGDDIRQKVATAALERRSFGGRGISSLVETTLVNPLARALFESGTRNRAATVSSLVEEQNGWMVTVS